MSIPTVRPHFSGRQLVAMCALAGLAFASAASAQTWSTGYFNTNAGYKRGFGIIATNQPAALRWEGNDVYNSNTTFGETDLVARVTGYTPNPGARSSLIQGGLGVVNDPIDLPGTNNVRIWKTFSPTPMFSSNSTVTFAAEWSLVPSLEAAPFNLNDTFAFDLRNGANNQSLLKLQFTPGINLQPNSYTLQTIAAGAPTNTLADLGYQALYQIQVDMTGSTYDVRLAQINPSTRTNIATFTLATGESLSAGTSAMDFGTLSLDWSLTSGNPLEPGSNYIIVNDVSAVPEPSVYALLGLGVLAGAVLMRLRKKA